MADFKIYQSEYAVRADNVRLRREIDQLRADNNRLRMIAGEPITELARVAIAPVAGESFKADSCTVSIAPSKGTATINPVLASGASAPQSRPATTNRPAVASIRPRVARPAAVQSAIGSTTIQPAPLQFAMDGDRGVAVGGPPARQPPTVVMQTPPTTEEQVEDDSVLRFSMVELR